MFTSDDLIDGLGGTFAVAKLLGISAPSVSEWRGRPLLGVPREKRILLANLAEEAGLCTRAELVPDGAALIWPDVPKGEARNG